MKGFIIIFVLFCNSFSGLCAGINVIYIDKNKIPDVKSIIVVVKKILQEKPNEDFMVYISNDMDPIIIHDMDMLSRDLEILYRITPSEPNCSEDAIKITYEINKKHKIQNEIEFNEKVHLFFILDASKSSLQKKKLIQRFLLINGWMNKNGLSENIKVSLYLNKGDCQQSKINEIKNNFNNLKYEISFF